MMPRKANDHAHVVLPASSFCRIDCNTARRLVSRGKSYEASLMAALAAHTYGGDHRLSRVRLALRSALATMNHHANAAAPIMARQVAVSQNIDFVPVLRLVEGVASWSNQYSRLPGCLGERFEHLFEETCRPNDCRSLAASAKCSGLTKSPTWCWPRGSIVRSARRSSGSRATGTLLLAPSWSSSRKSAAGAAVEGRAA